MTADYALVDLDGRLALALGQSTVNDTPVLRRTYLASTIPAADYPAILGLRPWFPGTCVGYGRIQLRAGGELGLDTTDWTLRHVETPIPQPRNGRTYTHVWSKWYGWQREPFPLCPDCRKYHDPCLAYCDNCGACHRQRRCPPGVRS